MVLPIGTDIRGWCVSSLRAIFLWYPRRKQF